jgi:hypothetical protein
MSFPRLVKDDASSCIQSRRAERLQARLDAAKAVTFTECVEAYIKAHRAGWRNGKHAAQWEATLATYAEPVIGKLSVQAVDTALVLKILEPIWAVKPETAARVRGRIEAVLDWATAREYRQARTQPVGGAMWTSSYRRAARCGKWSTTPRCPTASCRASW